jgi:hypothetical protein
VPLSSSGTSGDMAAYLAGYPASRGGVHSAPAALAPAAAQTTLKDFDVIQPLGKGSYGSVHKVRRKADGLE